MDDAQVVALRHYERLAVTFRGKPDPGMSLYAAQLKHMQSAQACQPVKSQRLALLSSTIPHM